MNACAAQIRAKEPTTACSPEVAAQAQNIADDSEAVAAATGGRDVVYWIAPKNGAEKSSSKLVFHLCPAHCAAKPSILGLSPKPTPKMLCV